MALLKGLRVVALLGSFVILLVGCGGENNSKEGAGDISMEHYTDSVFQVIKAHRTAYAKLIINRLVNDEQVIEASEHWKDDKALLLPAQMFRETGTILQESGSDISFSLLSIWPINKQNSPQTDAEKKGLDFVKANPGKNYYEQEKLGPKTYFTAVYPDNAVSMACVTCHNDHKDSPKTDFKMADNMGGVVIRIPVKG